MTWALPGRSGLPLGNDLLAMTLSAFLFAVLALLLAPGPTNTLMGLNGAAGGWHRVVRLIPAELLGYLTTVLPLAYLGADIVGRWPVAALVLKVVAAIWVLFLAVRLWEVPGRTDGHGAVTARRVYVTTVMNPKALVFGLILLPAPADPGFRLKLGLFLIAVIVAALAWNVAGSLTRIGNGAAGRLAMIQRTASVWLALVSVTLIAGALRA